MKRGGENLPTGPAAGMVAAAPRMYLRRLHIENLKLLREIDIPFLREDGQVRPWTVFVGENGLCKTTILQAIAMAASGPTLANELAEVISLPDRRLKATPASIYALFGFGSATHPLRRYPGFPTPPSEPPGVWSGVRTKSGWREVIGLSDYVDPVKPEKEDVNPIGEARREQLPHWFVAGYGTIRALPRPKSGREEDLADPIKHRLDNLFDRGSLIATAFADLFWRKQSLAYHRILKQVLIEGELLPRVVDLELRGPGELRRAKDLLESHLFKFHLGKADVKVPATWLSRGYQGTIAWIADLIGQILLDAGEAMAPEEMEGLVLIDELDLHLHPRWQAGLIPALKKVFPRLQFIATTHSAMLLPGLEQDEIWLLSQDEEGSVQAKPAGQAPALMTGSEILDTFFGIDRLYPSDLGDALRQYGYLASNAQRTESDERELERLSKQLKAHGVEPSPPVPRKRKTASKRPPRAPSGKKRSR